jgi:hypothetical protein
MLNESSWYTNYESVENPVVDTGEVPALLCRNTICPFNYFLTGLLGKMPGEPCAVVDEYFKRAAQGKQEPFNEIDFWLLNRQYPGINKCENWEDLSDLLSHTPPDMK